MDPTLGVVKCYCYTVSELSKCLVECERLEEEVKKINENKNTLEPILKL